MAQPSRTIMKGTGQEQVLLAGSFITAADGLSVVSEVKPPSPSWTVTYDTVPTPLYRLTLDYPIAALLSHTVYVVQNYDDPTVTAWYSNIVTDLNGNLPIIEFNFNSAPAVGTGLPLLNGSVHFALVVALTPPPLA